METGAKVLFTVVAVATLAAYANRYRHVSKDSNGEGTTAFLSMVGLILGLFAFALLLIGLVYWLD